MWSRRATAARTPYEKLARHKARRLPLWRDTTDFTSGIPRVCYVLIIIVAVPFANSMTSAQDGVCTLADHITSANTNTAIGFCPAGTSHDVITITEDITLTEPLPPITGTITD